MKHVARKRFGQNFLQDEGIIQQIIFAINPKTDENVIEIGPGKGALTSSLYQSAGKLNVIELDRDLIPILQRNLGSPTALKIHNVDALKFDFSTLASVDSKARIVGNLPYNISTPLLFHLISFAPIIADMHFMLQKEVVDRITAQPNNKSYGRLSVMLQYFCFTEKLFDVHPAAFNPEPKVDSAIIRLSPYPEKPFTVINESIFHKVVTQSFAQRRKTLRNNLKQIFSDQDILSLDIEPSIRAESLSLEQFVQLSNLASNKSLI